MIYRNKYNRGVSGDRDNNKEEKRREKTGGNITKEGKDYLCP